MLQIDNMRAKKSHRSGLGPWSRGERSNEILRSVMFDIKPKSMPKIVNSQLERGAVPRESCLILNT
jgi:hypothetical protein